MHLPLGFRFAAVHAGLKSDPTALDMSLVVSDVPAVCAGVFTQNVVCGAPVTVAQTRVPGEGFRAVVVNTRVANACTGEQGVADARQMAALAARLVGAPDDRAIAMSTGVVGWMLPMDKIAAGIDKLGAKLADSHEAFAEAAHGIMTTDTVAKYVVRNATLPSGTKITIAGFCKGSGMIAPNMATMLGVLCTDAAIPVAEAQAMLKRVADATFNCVSVDGDTSTSDMLILLANGASRDDTAVDTDKQQDAADLAAFERELLALCTELAPKIAADGEGLSHFVTIDVSGASDRDAARMIAKSIAESPLVKTAIAGADPNWGRIMCAAGYAGPKFDPARASLSVNGIELFRAGGPVPFDARIVSESLRGNRDTHIDLRLGEGEASIRFWTCDLTKEYVAINADYTT